MPGIRNNSTLNSTLWTMDSSPIFHQAVLSPGTDQASELVARPGKSNKIDHHGKCILYNIIALSNSLHSLYLVNTNYIEYVTSPTATDIASKTNNTQKVFVSKMIHYNTYKYRTYMSFILLVDTSLAV